jgi:hypothetical protein
MLGCRCRTRKFCWLGVRQERLSRHPGRAGRHDQQELDPANSPFGIPFSGRRWRMAKKSKAAVAAEAD